MLLTAAFLHATHDWGASRKLLNISSGLGRRAMASSGAYCAAKAGMDHFTRCLALEEAPAGSTLHSVADEGVPNRDIAAVIGRHLDEPVVSIAPEDAGDHFTWLAHLLAIDSPASSALTRELFGWDDRRDSMRRIDQATACQTWGREWRRWHLR